jgi:hypothetical protein
MGAKREAADAVVVLAFRAAAVFFCATAGVTRNTERVRR